jgi:hypothetical protein
MGSKMNIMQAFLKMSKGLYIWINIPSCEVPLIGKVEAFDETHVMLTTEKGIFVARLEDIAHVHLAIQAEIIS